VKDDGEAGELFECGAKREEVPAGEVGELAEGAVGEVEGAGAAEADGFGAAGGFVEERGDGVGHVSDDGLRAGADAGGHDAAGEELHGFVECADAQAGAAEIDAEVDERALVVRRNNVKRAGSQQTSGDAARSGMRMKMRGGRLLEKWSAARRDNGITGGKLKKMGSQGREANASIELLCLRKAGSPSPLFLRKV